ncbi:MAG: hypothetical protein NWE99_02185 [Candidatus Bathyarchaeota archaeon]|nr:hypothetical protein [Candidatus Bathyarchaeota archaeon]
MDKQVEFLVKLRDASRMIAEAANEYIDALAPPAVKEAQKVTTTVQEATFTILKFEPQQGAKLGQFEVAYKQNNLPDKWQNAYNILRNSNATIQNRYHGEDYQYSYWLYAEDKIYRQKLKPKT